VNRRRTLAALLAPAAPLKAHLAQAQPATRDKPYRIGMIPDHHGRVAT
jgi:hypothetical protein